MKRIGSIGLILFCLACAGKESAVVKIKTQRGLYQFQVAIAATPAEREHGLMGQTIKTHQGMLFVFPRPAQVAFWMKGTAIPLDIIFIDEAKRVLAVAQNTVPFSEERIMPHQFYRYVLEVSAGTAARIDLQVGDVVTLPTL